MTVTYSDGQKETLRCDDRHACYTELKNSDHSSCNIRLSLCTTLSSYAGTPDWQALFRQALGKRVASLRNRVPAINERVARQWPPFTPHSN